MVTTNGLDTEKGELVFCEELPGRSFGIARMLDTLGSVVGPLVLFGLLYIFRDSSTLYHNILLFTAIPLIITLLLVFKLREIPRAEYKKVEVINAQRRSGSQIIIFVSAPIIITSLVIPA